MYLILVRIKTVNKYIFLRIFIGLFYNLQLFAKIAIKIMQVSNLRHEFSNYSRQCEIWLALLGPLQL